MKAIPLISANLKGFIRNWKTVVLLIVFPFLLISVVFLSFSQNIIKVPVGIVASSEIQEYPQFKQDFNQLVKLTEYGALADCIGEIKRYNQYLCIEVTRNEDTYHVKIFFDNTREPVIWEVLQIVQSRIHIFKESKSIELISELLGGYKDIGDEITQFSIEIGSADSVLSDYIRETNNAVLGLNSAKTELSMTLDSMDSDINYVSSTEQKLKSDKNYYYSALDQQIYQARNTLNYITGLTYPNTGYISTAHQHLTSADRLIDSYNEAADSSFYDLERKIASYRLTSQRGRVYVYEIGDAALKLQNIRFKLSDYRDRLFGLRSKLGEMSSLTALVASTNPEKIARPFSVASNPSYLPAVSQSDLDKYGQGLTQAEKEAKGLNLIGLQTIFPKMLLLIIIFLSLLISNFICLNEVNSPAKIRLGLVHRIFFSEFLSTYISSIMIIAAPLTIVMLLGHFLFRLPLLLGISPLMLLFLLCNIFILIGMSLAYLVRKESITLVITTFLLLFIIFISGFIFPIERMSAPAQFLANIAPGKVTLNAIHQVVFYGQHISVVKSEITMLLVWSISFLGITLLVKKIRDKSQEK